MPCRIGFQVSTFTRTKERGALGFTATKNGVNSKVERRVDDRRCVGGDDDRDRRRPKWSRETSPRTRFSINFPRSGRRRKMVTPGEHRSYLFLGLRWRYDNFDSPYELPKCYTTFANVKQSHNIGRRRDVSALTAATSVAAAWHGSRQTL